MAKPKKVEAKKDNWKDARIKANAVTKAKRHAARMAEQKACAKRGLARALNRFCFSVSREMAQVMRRNGYTMSMLVRSKPKPKAKANDGLLLLNGKPMGSMAEALFTVRQIQEQARQRQAAAGVQLR